MKDRQRAWLLILLVAALCAAAVWGVARFRSRLITTAAMVARIPAQDALVLYVNFEALRQAGMLDLLGISKMTEEPEYKTFVGKTEFDYKEHLDSALVSFHPDGVFFLVRGQFDWKRLRSYAVEQGGSCYNALCRMIGSQPSRMISFFPLQSGLMGMAVSKDEWAATRMQENQRNQRKIEIPNDPVWVSVPSATLKSPDNLPAGTRMFARALENAENVTLSLGSRAQHFEARLAVQCRSEQDASGLAGQLDRITTLIRESIAREKQTPNKADLSGVLTSGTFTRDGSRVLGRWPLERAFLEALASGSE